MGSFIDLTGKRFSRLLVIEFSHKNKQRQCYWLCRCDCGEHKVIRGASLKNGLTQSCGCLKKELLKSKSIKLTEQKFGRLLLLNPFYFEKKRMYWECLCDCGNIKIASENSMRAGNTKSCGCLQKERAREIRFQDLVGQKFGRLEVISLSEKISDHSYWKCLCDCGNITDVIAISLKSGGTQSCGCLRSEKARERISGEKHHRWRGGNSKRQKYSEEWNEELRESLRNRDQHKCRFPDCQYDDTKEKRKLSVHHIDGNKQNCEEYNLISLCNKHHITIENDNPSLWVDYFYQITGDYR